MTTPAPKHAYELLTHPELGSIAAAQNAVEVAFNMMQREEERTLWLTALARNADALAAAARRMLGELP